MRLVVLAYQQVGYVGLKALLNAGADVSLVLTHHDDPGEEVWFESVGDLAEQAGISVLKPDDPNNPEIVDRIKTIDPDYIFSFYYRHLLSEPLLGCARSAAYNLHGSLLPAYRGRAPVNWVLVNGEKETGVTLHRMVKRPDAGPIVAQKPVPIDETDTVRELYAKICQAAGALIDETWPAIKSGRVVEVPQDETRASYFGARGPKDGRIDWGRPARNIYNLIRAVTHPYPGAFTYQADRRLFVWEARYSDEDRPGRIPGTVTAIGRDDGWEVACGRGCLWIRSAQWEDGPEVGVSDPEKLYISVGDRLSGEKGATF